MSRPVLLLACLTALGCGAPPPAQTAPYDPPHASARFDGLEGFWTRAEAEALLARAEPLPIAAPTDGLTEGERRAVGRLLEVGAIMQGLYEESRHPQARALSRHLDAFTPRSDEEAAHLESLRRLNALFAGPIAFDLESQRVPFAPVDLYEPGRNVYPSGLDAATFDAYVAAHPDEATSLNAPRTIVRRRSEAQLAADRAALDAHPHLIALHPTLAARLEAPASDDELYAIPYALAYAEPLGEASRLLFAAADDVRADDADLADYLEQRARDLLSNDYEAGDAAWVSGRFARLDAQIGAYETYDDHLLARKAFHSTSILVRAPDASAELARAVASLPALEAALPGGPYETSVRASIPIGIFDVLADFGQARGANTASILPNEPHVTRKYGRTILIRRNVLTHPRVVEVAQARFRAAVAEAHADDLGESGNFDRTVWHEVGHYLGPKTTSAGGLVIEALGNLQNTFEELKADLVSLWLMPRLVELGVLDDARRRQAYAAGVLRTLVSSEPPRSSPYGTMQLMQQRYFLEHGAMRFDPATGRLAIDYDAVPEAVQAMLTDVLALQRGGDRAAAEAFVERWAQWDEAVQGVLARAAGLGPRYWLPRYAALE